MPLFSGLNSIWNNAGPLLFKATGLALFSFLVSQVAFAGMDQKPSTRLIQHAMGTTAITGTPKRVVTLFQGATDSAVALGLMPVGVVESWVQKPVYEYLRASLRGSEIVGLETQPNLEKLVALKPDLIVAAKFRHEAIYPQLSAIAPVIYLEEIFDFKHTVQLMGQALNRDQKAREILDNWVRKIDLFRTQLSTKNNVDWPKDISLLNFRADHLRFVSQRSFSGSILKEVGFTHSSLARTDSWTYKKITSKEALPTINAETFFIFVRAEQPAVTQNYKKWQKHPLWKALQANRIGQAYEVDEIIWSLSGGIIGANMILDDLFRIYKIPMKDGMI